MFGTLFQMLTFTIENPFSHSESFTDCQLLLSLKFYSWSNLRRAIGALVFYITHPWGFPIWLMKSSIFWFNKMSSKERCHKLYWAAFSVQLWPSPLLVMPSLIHARTKVEFFHKEMAAWRELRVCVSGRKKRLNTERWKVPLKYLEYVPFLGVAQVKHHFSTQFWIPV